MNTENKQHYEKYICLNDKNNKQLQHNTKCEFLCEQSHPTEFLHHLFLTVLLLPQGKSLCTTKTALS